MKVKEVDRMATIAWSPESLHPIYLACGSAAQQVVDATFNSSASLEIFDLNLTEPGLDMVPKYTIPSDVRFEKLIWGKYGMGGDHPSGILVGGTSNGRVRIYDVAKCLANPTDPNGGIMKDHTRHSGAVYALDFNGCQANLLASGSVQSEVFIWDLNSPNQIPMTPGAKAQPLESVTALAWNPKVQHILASAFAPRAVVWDLRKNEPIIKVADAASRLKLKAVAWHPEVATQLCLASEDDMHPIIQLWDLRFASSPLNTMEAHQRGVLSLAWCKQDPDLMLSCGRDNRIICWNPNTTVQGGEIVCELKGCQEWCFEVAWCPRNPAVVAASSFDGHVSVFSLLGSQAQLETPSKLAESFPGMESIGAPTGPLPTSGSTVDLKKPPKWLRRPCGVSWGFGGKLVSWQVPEVSRRSVSSSSPTEEEPRRHIVTVMQVITEPDLVAKAKSLIDALKTGQAGLSGLCSQHLQGLSVGDLRELDAFVGGADDVSQGVVWRCIEAHLSLSARSSLLSLLGVGSQELAAQLSKALGKNKIPDGGDAVMNGSAGPEDAFESMSLKPQVSKKPFNLFDKASSDLCLALVGGHLDAALKLCMNEKRYAEALVLANLIGGPVVRETQEKFLETVDGGVGYLLRSLSSSKWDSVVEGCDVRNWRHALCAVLTYGKDQDEVANLCSKMGERLEADGKTRQALVCHMIGGDLEGVSRVLEKGAEGALGNEDRPKHLQTLDHLELVLLLKQSMSSTVKGASQELVKTVKTCVEHLSSQGELELATNILGYFPELSDPGLDELRNRLASSSMAAAPSPQHAPVQRGFSQPNRFAKGSFSQPSPSINQFQQSQPGPPMFSPSQPSQQPPPPVPTMNAPPPTNFGPPPTNQMSAPAPPPASLPPPPSGPAVKPMSRAGPLQPRYVADPNMYNTGYGVTPAPAPPGPSSGPMGYNSGFQSQAPQSNFYNPSPSPGPQQPMNTFTPIAPPQQSMPPVTGPPQQSGPPPMTSAAPPIGPPPTAPPPGWNDPPTRRAFGSKMKIVEGIPMGAEHAGIHMLLGARKSGKSQPREAPAPIMQPVFAPIADPFASQMPQMGMGGPMNAPMGMGPPPGSAPMSMQGGYGPPMGMSPSGPRPGGPMNMSMGQPPQQHPPQGMQFQNQPPQQRPPQGMQFQNQPPQQQQPPQGMQFQSQQSAFAPPMAPMQPLNINPPQQLLTLAPQMSPAMPPAAPSPVPMAQAAHPEPPAKQPLAPEHAAIMEVLTILLRKCSGVATHPQMKRKLDDVSKKLDVLHAKLASNALSPTTVSSLQGLAEALRGGEYPKAMSFHTQVVTTGAFSEISSFMPGIKILIQVAMQLGVYVN